MEQDPLASPLLEEETAAESLSPTAVHVTKLSLEEPAVTEETQPATTEEAEGQEDAEQEQDTVLLLGSVANLCSATLGAGILSLPYAFQQAGLLAGVLLLVLSAGATFVSIRIIVQACDFYNVFSYEALVDRIQYKSARPLVEVCTLVFCGGVMVAYCIAVGDILQLSGLLLWNSRELSLLLVWTTIMLPLSLLRTMQSLQWASSMGIASISTLVFAALVHLVDDDFSIPTDTNNTTTNTTNGTDYYYYYYHHEDMNLSMLSNSTSTNDTVADWTTCLWPANGITSILTACPIILFAFSCQVNVCAIYHEIPGNNNNNNKTHVMNRVARTAVLVCSVLYLTLSLAVLADFDTVLPNVLLNYAPPTGILQVATASMAVAVVFAFPLNIFPARVTLTGILAERAKRTYRRQEQRGTVVDDEEAGAALSEPLLPESEVITNGNETTHNDDTDNENENTNGPVRGEETPADNDDTRVENGYSLIEPPSTSPDTGDQDADFDWKQHISLTLGLAGSALCLALVVPNISLVFGLLGGTTASALGFVIPGALGLRLYQEPEGPRPRSLQIQSWILLVGGILVGGVTTAVTLYTTLV